jgi:hypothetical protein
LIENSFQMGLDFVLHLFLHLYGVLMLFLRSEWWGKQQSICGREGTRVLAASPSLLRAMGDL